MTVDEWVQVALAIGTVAAALLAYYAIRRDTRRDIQDSGESRIKELARVEQEPLKDRISINDARITQMRDTINRIDNTLNKIDANIHDTRERLSGVEMLQKQHIEQLTMSLMKQMHQPDPRRAEIDRLLEAYMEGAISKDEIVELKKVLVKIRNFEPTDNQAEDSARELGFPVFPGEQTAAAILLGTMDLVDPARLANYGHSKHRSEEHKNRPGSENDER